jgi:uncharacterized protein YoxC
MDAVTIFTIILLAAAACLCVAMIFYLKKITQSFENLRTDVKSLTDEVKPLIISTRELSKKLNALSTDLKEPVETAKEIIYNIKDRVDRILVVEEKIRGGFEGQVSGLIKNLSSVVNGVSTFWKTFRKNNQ